MYFSALEFVAVLSCAVAPAAAHKIGNARPHRRSLQYEPPNPTFGFRQLPHFNLALPPIETAAAAAATSAVPTPTVLLSILHTVLAAQTTELPKPFSPIAGLKSPQCGDSGAEAMSSYNNGPNGSGAWLTCGVSKMYPNSGWVRLFRHQHIHRAKSSRRTRRTSPLIRSRRFLWTTR